jgi:hypothetical protein
LIYRFPAAIGLASKQEIGTGDVYAPSGTQIDLTIVASQSLSRAEWQFGENDARPMRIVADTLAHFTFAVEKDGYYLMRLTSTAGLNSTSVEYFIHVTPDEAPLITLERPGRDVRLTMLEETAIEVRVRDDYGLKKLDLIYSINEQSPVRQDWLAIAKRASNSPNGQLEYRGASLLFLENLNVQPGDFISLYFEAADAKQTASTDLYFLEVRPFTEEFYRALSQGGSAGGGESPSGLSASQKQIITATWKLERSRQKLSAEEMQEGCKALTETQASLRESVMRILDAARMAVCFPALGRLEMDAGKIIECLKKATEAMREAEPLLRRANWPNARSRAPRVSALLKAEAEMQRREVAMGGGASEFRPAAKQRGTGKALRRRIQQNSIEI